MRRKPSVDGGREPAVRATLQRRSFLRDAGAAISAGLASAALVAAPASADTEPQQAGAQAGLTDQLALLQDRQAIRTLHRRFGAALNQGRYEDIVDLFADESQVEFNGGIFSGKQRGVRRLYVEYLGARAAVSGKVAAGSAESGRGPVHRQLLDEPDAPEIIEVAADRRAARARFHCVLQAEVAVGTTSSLIDMARLQGQGVVRWWESGEFENAYVRERGVWKIQRLVYRATTSVRLMSAGERTSPRSVPAFSSIYPQDPTGPDALVG